MVDTDSFRAQGLRKRMVEDFKSRGIVSQSVLRALNMVPRHLFIDSSFFEYAYQDKAFPIGCEQTISHPFTVAFQTQLLDISTKDKVLEIGTGCGYQTAILCEIGAKIYTIERILSLHNKAKSLLETMFYYANFFYGDGYDGLPKFAPFDKILVTCGAPEVPKNLLQQLKIGGKIVVPVGTQSQKMLRITRVAETEFSNEEFGDFQFVPMLEDSVAG